MGDEPEFLGMVDEMIKKLLDSPKQPLGGARRTGAPRGAPPRGTDGTAATVQLVRTRAAPRMCPYVGCMSKFN